MYYVSEGPHKSIQTYTHMCACKHTYNIHVTAECSVCCVFRSCECVPVLYECVCVFVFLLCVQPGGSRFHQTYCEPL